MSAAIGLASSHLMHGDSLIINLSNGVDETLQKMANVVCVFEKSFNAKNWKPKGEFSVLLEVESPPSSGQIRLHFSKTVLTKLYKSIMEADTIPDQEQALDCLGEISNITYGIAKVKLNEEGFALGLSLPHPSKTEDLPQIISNQPRSVIPFKIFGETCFIEIVIF